MTMKTRILKGLLWFGCLVLGAFALACFFTYGRELVASVGSSDKSLLFWYLPFLFLGFFCAMGAIACWIVATGRHRGKKP